MQIILIPEKPTASMARIDVRVWLGWKEFPGNGVLTNFVSQPAVREPDIAANPTLQTV
jgi:hypothetical protein